MYPADVFREATTEFTVDARPLTKAGGDHIRTQITSPSGSPTDCLIQDNADGMYSVEYTPFEKGNFWILVFCLFFWSGFGFFYLRGENQEQAALLTLSSGKLLRSAINLLAS